MNHGSRLLTRSRSVLVAAILYGCGSADEGRDAAGAPTPTLDHQTTTVATPDRRRTSATLPMMALTRQAPAANESFATK